MSKGHTSKPSSVLTTWTIVLNTVAIAGSLFSYILLIGALALASIISGSDAAGNIVFWVTIGLFYATIIATIILDVLYAKQHHPKRVGKTLVVASVVVMTLLAAVATLSIFLPGSI